MPMTQAQRDLARHIMQAINEGAGDAVIEAGVRRLIDTMRTTGSPDEHIATRNLGLYLVLLLMAAADEQTVDGGAIHHVEPVPTYKAN